jgi:hypothetical protein
VEKQEASRSSSNNKHKHKGQWYDGEFSPQMHLDFAALTDSNRAIQVKSKSVKGNDLVSVAVSSYKLPTDMKLAALVEDPVAQQKLASVVRSVSGWWRRADQMLQIGLPSLLRELKFTA